MKTFSWCILLLFSLMNTRDIKAKSVISDISDELIKLFKITPNNKNATEDFIRNELRTMVNKTIIEQAGNDDNGDGEGELHQRAPGAHYSPVNIAYAHDINNCLFDSWIRTKNILSAQVDCHGRRTQLCYRTTAAPASAHAQFAVCYNDNKGIPDYTGHVVNPIKSSASASKPSAGKTKKPPRPIWVDETSVSASNNDDYFLRHQNGVIKHYDEPNQQFYNRGHLTPNGDFSIQTERDQTFIIANAAPQWALFNSGNWERLEDGVRSYATSKGGPIYVVTGTGGEAVDPSTGRTLKIGPNQVTVPKYFWKAICDPGVGSVLFIAENPISIEKSSTQVKTGCTYTGKTPRNQFIKDGVLECLSLDDARSDVSSNTYRDLKDLFPPFSPTTCLTSKRGEFITVNRVTR